MFQFLTVKGRNDIHSDAPIPYSCTAVSQTVILLLRSVWVNYQAHVCVLFNIEPDAYTVTPDMTSEHDNLLNKIRVSLLIA